MLKNLQEKQNGESENQTTPKATRIKEQIVERFVGVLSSADKTKVTRKPKSGKGI